MGRVLGIDFGDRRIGLALADPTGTIASPFGTLTKRAGKRPPWAELEKVARDYDVDEAVIGLPLALSGEDTEWTATVRQFAADFERRTGIPTSLLDERMTSVLAERAVRGSGLRRSQRERKDRIDETAAAFILRTFLERKNNRAADADG